MSSHRQAIFLPLILLLSTALPAETDAERSGMEIMEEIYARHQQYPYVYEQQSMVLKDRNGKRDTRKARRFSRVEEDGTAKFMLLFDFPEEINGVAILATRTPDGEMSKSIYLPAFAEQMHDTGGEDNDGNFLGTDFSVESIVGEILSDYKYLRQQDRVIKDLQYYVVDVFEKESNPGDDKPLRRHFIRQDNMFIGQTEHYDVHGRVDKRQSYHDLKAVDGEMWRSGMILMEDLKEQHQSLLKVTRRMFSHDYVPAEMFTPEWLYENHPYIAPLEDDEETSDLPDNESDKQISQVAEEEVMTP